MPPTRNDITAGFIGLGAMGTPMASHLARHGLLRGVWNRTPARAVQAAQEFGVPAMASPLELASAVDLILLCVSADPDVLSIVQALLPALDASKVVVDLSTVSPETAVEAERLIHQTGASFLDAPVTGGVEGARNATLAMMVGGANSTLDRVWPILGKLANRIFHMGDTGMGQAAKAVNQVMCAGINEAVTEALALGERLDLDMDKLIGILSGGAAGNWFLEKRGDTMTRGIFEPGFKLALHHKDLMIVQKMAENLDFPLELTRLTIRDYETLLAQGFGDEDISTLYRLKHTRTSR